MWALIGFVGLGVVPGWPGAHALGPPVVLAQAATEEAEAAEATDVTEIEVAGDAKVAMETETDVAEEIQASEVTAESPTVLSQADGTDTVVEEVEEAWVLQKTRELTSTGSDRAWHVSGSLSYRGLAVVDPDPSNDQYLIWRLRGDYDVIEGGRVWVSLRLDQRFWAEGGVPPPNLPVDGIEESSDSGFRFQDVSLGFDYGHEVGLDFVPLEAFAGRKLDLEHRAGIFLPTSRASINQDMVAAPYVLSRARYSVLEPLIVGLDGWFRYRFHRYAERAGQQGGMNTQLDFGLSWGVEYVPLTSKEWGTVSVGADIGWSYYKKYASREEFVSAASSQTMWNQDYSWDVYATYTPVKYATLVVGMEQNAYVLQEGVLNINPFHRDQTEYFVQVLARY